MCERPCKSCGRITAHKRIFGTGTCLALIFSVGFWTLLMPFYPRRCVICGTSG